MRRLQLFEFNDLEQFPQFLRHMVLAQLMFIIKYTNPYGKLVPKLKQVLEKMNCHHIVDLCSGATGPLVQIQRQFEDDENYPITITLTDKFPHRRAFEKAGRESNKGISWVDISVDVMNVPKNLKGFRTLFTAFHHFDRDSAKQILEDAVRSKEGIGIFELTDRHSFPSWIEMFLTPFISFLTVPHFKPLTWKKLFYTYIFPVFPLVAFWDAVISNIRTYSQKELRQMVDSLDGGDYNWEIGRIDSTQGIYLIGYPLE
ncbi:MAG: hypothetical protein JRJ20_04525 [Deltaproteobacteria bacterium]|nr:hypothetical protein [Deltaproteobacteria bacterium]MBW2143537.1 hypothetical protein [Deltaproteobacteria bacterium]